MIVLDDTAAIGRLVSQQSCHISVLLLADGAWCPARVSCGSLRSPLVVSPFPINGQQAGPPTF